MRRPRGLALDRRMLRSAESSLAAAGRYSQEVELSLERVLRSDPLTVNVIERIQTIKIQKQQKQMSLKMLHCLNGFVLHSRGGISNSGA